MTAHNLAEKPTPVAGLQRTAGVGRIAFKPAPSEDPTTSATRLETLYQEGAAKVRLPKVYSDMAEAVLINTSGGLTGGDVLDWSVEAGVNTRSVLTTQACEKIYKASEGTANVTSFLSLDKGSELHWLPQETILFDRASLSRQMHVHMAEDARFLAVEAVILGRDAMGEQVEMAHFSDRWRIHRGGKLVHADDLLFSGEVTKIAAGSSTLARQRAFASVVYLGPEDQEVLEARCDALRPKTPDLSFGISTVNGKITARLTAATGFDLRQKLIPFLQGLRPERALPKLWSL
ncbi:urease accessory protein UreD [Pseudovibrio sp. SPO723]|uniref:urease accessory protein UreD n=1 Tax=Nesiotobacter zosterae TaxID=392721 RepID=UPI0029C4074B|nr:urease accessory protein UreD [Pseudovibrio sp. SPO723]MDX5594402.1 urease accessory protein UreD [Pseudovibrio sp. SPO723]